MTHYLNNGVITFNYDGKIEERKNLLLCSSIINYIKSIEHNKEKYVLISLTNVKYENNRENLAILINKLHTLTKTNKIIIGLMDYNTPTYELLKILTKNTRIVLFKNFNTAKLFINPKSFKKNLHILIYDENEENTHNISYELSEYGYAVTETNDLDEFKKLTDEKKYEFTVTQSTFNKDLKHKEQNKVSLPLSKKLISNLPLFMDIAVETLVTFTGLTANKVSHSITYFNKDLISNVVCSLMRFKGDIRGSFVLVFPKETALVALEALLGEKVNEDDTESIMDGVGEFCNTITGSTKTSLSKKDIKIIFELPRTYTSLQKTYNEIGDNNGIWINMQLAGKPFYMFITK